MPEFSILHITECMARTREGHAANARMYEQQAEWLLEDGQIHEAAGIRRAALIHDEAALEYDHWLRLLTQHAARSAPLLATSEIGACHGRA